MWTKRMGNCTKIGDFRSCYSAGLLHGLVVLCHDQISGNDLLFYGAVTCVPPAGKWPGEIFPPHAAVVACTLNMIAMSPLVYAAVHFCEHSSSQAPGT